MLPVSETYSPENCPWGTQLQGLESKHETAASWFEAKSYPWLGSWQHWCNIYINRVKSDTAKTFQILTYYWWGQIFLESCHPKECINGQTWIRIFTGGRQKGDRVARMGWEQQSGKISDCYGILTSLSLSFRLYVCVVCVCVCTCPCIGVCLLPFLVPSNFASPSLSLRPSLSLPFHLSVPMSLPPTLYPGPLDSISPFPHASLSLSLPPCPHPSSDLGCVRVVAAASSISTFIHWTFCSHNICKPRNNFHLRMIR